MTLKSLIPVGGERGVTRAGSNPFFALQQEIDRLFDGFTRGFAGFPSRDVMPSMDLSETDKEIEITAELPGLDEKNLDVQVSGDVLTIKGEKVEEKEEKQKNTYLSERRYGSLQRSFQLPAGVDLDKVAATFEKGVLRITLPKTAEAVTQQKKIPVKST